MESFDKINEEPNEDLANEKLSTGLKNFFNRISKSALTGAALIGAMAGTPADADAEAAGRGNRLEQSENFSQQRETAAFLEKISSIDGGFGDARGRSKLRQKVESYLNVYALAIKMRTASFSSDGDSSVRGTVNFSEQMIAREILLSALSTDSNYSGPGIDVLKSMIGAGGPSVSTPSRTATERSVNRTKDW